MIETTVPATSAAPLPAGPRSLPLIGNLPRFARDPLGFFCRLSREYGDVARFSLGGGHKAVLVTHPDHIGQVLMETGKTFSKSYQKDFSTAVVFGNGLATSEGSFWRRQRKLAAPAFHSRRLNLYAETMVRFTQDAVEEWQEGRTIDLHEEMMFLTQRIAAKTLFGADVAGVSRGVGEALDDILREMTAEMNGLGAFLPHGVPTPGRSRLKNAVSQIDRVVQGIVDERRADLEGSPEGESRDDLLAMLMEARDDEGMGMTDKQLRDEIVTLYIAGHETTANALSWAWMLLAQDPATMAELKVELKRVLDGRLPTVEDVPALAYTNAAVKETLRLYPPAWTFFRVAGEGVRIGGYDIPKGTQVWISQWVTHRDGRFFENPNSFAPQRWLDGLEKRLPRYAYLPFGGGPRVCIGNRFAQMEAVLILATIAQRYRPQVLDGGPEPEPSMTLRPKGEMKARLARTA